MTVIAAATTLAATMLLAAPAQAQPAPRECRDDDGANRCAADRQAQTRALFQVLPIEALADQRTLTRRAFFVDGYGNDVGVIAFTRAMGAEPQVSARFRRRTEDGVSVVELSSVISASLWNRVVEQGRYFDRDLAPRAGSKPPPPICLHGWVATVEAADTGDRPVRRKTQAACGGNLAVSYAFELAAQAVEAMPACALLDSQHFRNDVERLGRCTLLEGDRAAAAEAYNRLRYPYFDNPRGAESAQGLYPLFLNSTTIAWQGEPVVKGASEASLFWATKAEGGSFWPRSIEGLSPDRVLVQGGLSFVGSGPEEARLADATMVWTRFNGHFRVSEITIGEWRQTPGPGPS